MKHTNKSIFNLIEIFSAHKHDSTPRIDSAEHCAHQQLHDFYCDNERPFISLKS